ncbi:MAG: DUF488 domain-containing protein [Proteobacteria bacterium]|nr:DUF488 domain-containing protein [Pseudomonadota bacterium]
MTVTLHTIGYQGRDPESFVAALIAAGIATLIDVRAGPHSRKPGFSKSQLAQHLQEAGIAYLHLVALGNPPAGREAAKAGRIEDYRRAMGGQLDSEAGQGDLRNAAGCAAASPSCLMCFEADAAQCHRSLVAARLADQHGFQINHIPGTERQTALPL